MKKSKLALLQSVISLLLCVSMLMGTTFAWFTDTVTSSGNIIKSGTLDAELYWTDTMPTAGEPEWQDASQGAIFNYSLWEPGYTQVRYVKITNEGSLAFRYRLNIIPQTQNTEEVNLADVIDVYLFPGDTQLTGREQLTDEYRVGTLSELMADNDGAAHGVLLPEGAQATATEPAGELTACIVLKMQESAGNEYQNRSVGGGFRVVLMASQYTWEEDSFGNDYDKDSEYGAPNLNISETASTNVQVENNATTQNTSIQGVSVSAQIPAGVQVSEGTSKLTLEVTEKDESESNVTLGENEDLRALDVHMDGVASDNTQPMEITIRGAAPIGMNNGNLKLYHVEGTETKEMTQIGLNETFTAHNQFKYDPLSGDVILYMATFSEVAVVADTDNPWNGDRVYDWYDASKTELVIASADQLAGLSAIVGGMDGQTQDSFSGKTVKLIANINIGDTIADNGKVFYPIGYYNSNGNYDKVSGISVTSGFKTFEGTFDGNGHTIANFYQNTWEMFGDYNDGYSGTPNHYRDGMGLFGKVYGGTVKNLTVKNFSSDGEFTTTGTIAAYADCGATFENIAIFNCNPRVYNIGNGGIVGCVGWYAKDAHNTPVTFKNITVDNTNKISALWGSWDVACGGLVGQYYPTSGQENAIDNAGIHMENCHVAAQIDVYNDVCANYQYYAYRYAGILVGSVRENVEQDGHVYPKMDDLSAENCTVHFGDWNDYYYCELVANSLASYTHDHQMSRLEQVASVDVANMKVTSLDGAITDIPTSGRYNYVVVKAKGSDGKWVHGDGAAYATCYHFVDGKVWNHADAGSEEVDTNGDGVKETVLKEDKQLVYREFNNLVTGYGWGVTSKGVGEMDGVTILDREEGNSYVKFEVQDTISDAYRANNSRAIGRLFKAAMIADPKLAINSENVVVTVSPKIGTNSTAGGIYTPNTSDWTKGTIVFTGKGAAVITITDYYFCTATTFEVEIVENRVTGLSVKTNKNLYDISKNETFSASDITVTAVYSDGNARTLDVSDFTYTFKENAGDFTTFGEKNGVVTYTYAEDTVTAEFKVVAVSMKELALSGGGGKYELYFEQFGINAVGQQFYMAPGKNTINGDLVDGNVFGAATLEFATGTVDYTVGWNGGSTVYSETNAYGAITINCTTAPFADIFGYVGYADNRVPIAFGVYVDTADNLTYSLPMDANADINTNTGTENSKIFYIQAPLNTMNLSSGEHTVTFVSIFADGIQTLTKWTVNIAEKEEEDISQKTANVIILAGQSNAYGASALTEAVKSQAVVADYSNIFINYSNINCENGVWKSLYYNSGFEPYHPGVGGTVDGACFGPEVGIAYQLATNEATKDEVWYIIKYTAAGSMLDGQWLAGKYDNEGLVSDMGGYLSDLMIDYVHDSLAKIEAIHGTNVKIHSFVWMQGESDALADDCAGKYQANEAALVNKVREEFASYANNDNGDNIIFVSGAIAKNAEIQHGYYDTNGKFVAGYFDESNDYQWTAGYRVTPNGWTYSDTVNKGKNTNAKIEWEPVTNSINNKGTGFVLPNSACIDTSTLLVGANAGENNDAYHYSSASMWNLGQWFGIAINYLDLLGLNNTN
ncbi:MAG: bacterial Ig-like domain-containing protein [Oscillospiraceae bacterium]|nr:bacterial Ig-like domain-containing protein [Oscillospiraceae bacterium]